MRLTIFRALLAISSLAFAQVFNDHTEPFHLALKSTNATYDGTSLVACVYAQVYRHLCHWPTPASKQKQAPYRFDYSSSDFSQLGYLTYNLTTVSSQQVNVTTEWVPLGLDLSSVSNTLVAEFVSSKFSAGSGIESQLVRWEEDGRLAVNGVYDSVTGTVRGLSNWFMCETKVVDRKVVLHWAVGHSPGIEDLDAVNCVKVEVVGA
jgi:hypothetical protein